ncbi:MAG: hypothetical protein IJ849_08925 [Selenomonadaceae bacterium]|nr:hypothetical protein [Selenomonadaceae bacterium]
MNGYQAFYEMVKKWTVNDYHTQGIKAEVILDMLISEFIEEMVAAKMRKKLDAVKLLAKEFPIRTTDKNLRNAKVDYLVQVEDKIYLTELKTTNDSFQDTQAANMQNAVNRKAADLWDFFRQIVTSKEQNRVDSQKYAFTLKRLKEKVGWEEGQPIPESLTKAELDILYIGLHETPQSGKFFRHGQKHFYLEHLSANRNFIAALEAHGKNAAWDKLSEILSAVLEAAVKFEGGKTKLIKTKTFAKNNAEYQKFYASLVAELTEPGLIGLDEYDLAPLKDFTGSVYMGEAEAVGENAIKLATKAALSKAENLGSAAYVLLSIYSSEDKVDMSEVNEATAFLDELAPEMECVFSIHIDDTLGDTVRVMVVAKIP